MATGSPEDREYIPLSEAAKIAPGRTTPNCVWRWCRTGVLARNGERVRLEHVRVGGKIFTKRSWVDQFCKRLAERDAAYFDAKAAERVPPRDPKYAAPLRKWRNTRPRPVSAEAKRRFDETKRRQEETDRRLEEQGL